MSYYLTNVIHAFPNACAPGISVAVRIDFLASPLHLVSSLTLSLVSLTETTDSYALSLQQLGTSHSAGFEKRGDISVEPVYVSIFKHE